LDLPRPQATPMNACPGLRARWCPRHIAIARPELLPSAGCIASAFLSHCTGRFILLTTTQSISGLNTQPVKHPGIFGAPPIHPASYSHCWACTWTSLLTCRLDFGRMGLEPQPTLTHWVTLSNFIPPFGNPNDWRLTWREHPLIYTGLKFTLALDVGISQGGCVRKRKPLDTLFRIERLMKSPLTNTYHRYGWSQAYGDLGLNSPFFIVRRIGYVARLCQ
jgi:hypothetical protein